MAPGRRARPRECGRPRRSAQLGVRLYCGGQLLLNFLEMRGRLSPAAPELAAEEGDNSLSASADVMVGYLYALVSPTFKNLS